MTPNTWIVGLALSFLLGALSSVAWYRQRVRRLRRQVAVMAAELADLRDAHSAAVQGVQVVVHENAKLRTLRPLVLNGKIYCSYKIFPERIYHN